MPRADHTHPITDNRAKTNGTRTGLIGSPRTGAGEKTTSPERLLLRISAAISAEQKISQILDTILAETMHAMQAQEGSILLHDWLHDRLEMLASRGLSEDMRKRGYIPRKGSIAEWVMENNQPQILSGSLVKKPYQSGPGERSIISAMCLPLRAKGCVIGTLNLNRTAPDSEAFRTSDMRLMTIVTAHVAESIELARQQELRLQSERLAAIGETITGVSHCIKNLLTSLEGGLLICTNAMAKDDREMHDRGRKILERAVTRVSALTLDMLEYSKDRKLKRSSVRLDKLLDEVVSLKTDRARTAKVELQYHVAYGAEVVRAANDQLFRCILNLVENAIDATPHGGRVNITAELDRRPETTRHLTERSDVAVTIYVSDTGTGIKPELLETVFTPFFSTKGSRGTGLGLAVTRKIVHELGGEISVESEPGQGATFRIYLPAPELA